MKQSSVRDFKIFYAKVNLAASAQFRNRGGDFHWWLFNVAQKARREAQALVTESKSRQGDLFGGGK